MKQKRLERLMSLQQEISTEIGSTIVGQTHTVVVDRKEGDYYIGRTQYSSPEVDPEVLIDAHERKLRVGSFYNVRITDSTEFDLIGTTL